MFGPSLKSIEKMFRQVLDVGEGSVKKIQELKAEIRILKEEKEDLEFKKRMEEKEIEHLVKMKEEKMLIEIEKEKAKLDSEFRAKTMSLQSDYHDKVIKTIEESRKEARDLYTAIMDRLPNVNMEIKKESK